MLMSITITSSDASNDDQLYNYRMTNQNKCLHLKSSNNDNNSHNNDNMDNASTTRHIKETMIYNNSNIPMVMKNNKWPDNTLLIIP